MNDSEQTIATLRAENAALRSRVVELEHERTERKRAEDALRESEKRFRDIAENALEWIWEVDANGKYTYASPVVEEILGYKPEEVLEKNFYDLFHPEDHDELKKAALEVFTKKQAFREFINRNVHKYGKTIWLSTSGVPVLDEEGNLLGYRGADINITDRKRAEDALRESEGKLNGMLQSIGDHISVMDRDLNILWANESAKRIFGNDIVGKKCYETYHRRRAPCEPTPCLTLKAFQDGKVHEHDTQVIDKDGRTLCFHCTANVALRDKEGQPIGVMEISRDITDRKRTEEELAKHRHHLEELVEQRTRELESSREQLRQSARLASLGTLTAGIAHEINNPVGMIRLSAENALGLRDKPGGAELVDRALNKILRHAERCGQITRSMLQFARQEPTEKWPSGLNTAVDRAVEHVRADAMRHRVELEVELSDDLPEVVMNPIQVEQAFVNMIQNAVESSGPGTRVTVLTESTPDAVRGTVSDTGRGMTTKEQARVFDPFYTTRFQEGGTGLGLSIVHGIIAEHGGTIRVESEPGRGTTITVELPCDVRRDGERPHVKDTGR